MRKKKPIQANRPYKLTFVSPKKFIALYHKYSQNCGHFLGGGGEKWPLFSPPKIQMFDFANIVVKRICCSSFFILRKFFNPLLSFCQNLQNGRVWFRKKSTVTDFLWLLFFFQWKISPPLLYLFVTFHFRMHFFLKQIVIWLQDRKTMNLKEVSNRGICRANCLLISPKTKICFGFFLNKILFFL